ncbi:MAG: hypothetical protein ACI4TD_14140 [Phocaeicola sp.]
MADDEDVAEFFFKMLPKKVSSFNKIFKTGAPLLLTQENQTATVSYDGFAFIRFSALPVTGLYKANTSDGSFIGLLIDYISMANDVVINGKTFNN